MASWKALSGVPNFFADTMLLMTDGSVLVHDASSSQLGGVNWYRLTPDNAGKYDTAGATWTGPFPMANARQFWASGVLQDGRAFVVGGEKPSNTPLGEIFDPQTNTWSTLPKPSPQFDFIQGDACGCILSDGRVLFGAIFSNRTAIWNPADHTSNAWQEAGKAFNTLATTTKQGVCDEETWSLLPDGTVLTVDISASPIAEKYDPATDTWIAADQTSKTLTKSLALPSLLNTTVTPPVPINISEIGPAMLLPDGRLFFVGATGHTALYTPPASPALPGSWTIGPDLPADTSGNNFNSPNGNIQTSIDAPAVLLPGGKVLFACGNTRLEGGNQFWSNPTLINAYDPVANSITKLASQPPSNSVDTWQARFLLLPTGEVLITSEQKQTIAIMNDPAIIGTPNAAWKPVITSFTPVMAVSHHYKISGKLLNGLSQAVCYGDDSQMGTNYPLARFTNTGTGAVSYFRTFDFSTFAVASPAIHDTLVEIPASAAPGDYTLQVVANGIASDPVNVKIVPNAPAITVNLEDNLHFQTVCGPAWLTMEVFNVGGAELIVNSVSRFSGSADFSVLPNPVTPLTISPGDHVDFTIAFNPTTVGVPESAVIRIDSNDPITPDFDVTATGTGGTASLESVVVDSGFIGDVCLGSFADTEITLNNTGSCRLIIRNITAAPPDFEVPSVLSYPLVVAPGSSIDIPIRFRPLTLGAKAGVVSVVSNDTASPKLIHLAGNAPAPRLVTIIADSGYWGNVCVDSFSDRPLTLSNAGHCPLTVTAITSSSTDFLVPSVHIFPFTIAPGTAIEIPIRFQPAGHGLRSGVITILSDDPAGATTVSVSGDAPWGKLAVTGSTYFGEVDCGVAQKTISVCNIGDCPLHVTSVAFSRKRRHFKLVNNPFPAKLRPGSCLGLVIQYCASCDPECCELVIKSDDPEHPVKVLDVVAFTRCVKKCCCRCEEKCECGCGCEKHKKHDRDCGEEDDCEE